MVDTEISEQQSPADTDNDSAPEQGTSVESAPADKDWKAEADKWKALARKHEGQSKTNADKAKQFDELTEAQKTELQRATDRADQAEARAAEVEQRAMRAEVAAAKGVPAELLAGSTITELEASADKLIEFRGPNAAPDFGAGDRGGDAGKPSQMTRDELKRLYAAGKHAEIDQARKEGRLDGLFTRI